MMKWLRFASFGCVLAVLTGCGARELPPKTDSTQPAPSAAEGKEKAMQGMPPEVKKQMEERMRKMPK